MAEEYYLQGSAKDFASLCKFVGSTSYGGQRFCIALVATSASDGRVLADNSFDAAQYGDTYISLLPGDEIHQFLVDGQWACGYSKRRASHGWYPADCVQEHVIA